LVERVVGAMQVVGPVLGFLVVTLVGVGLWRGPMVVLGGEELLGLIVIFALLIVQGLVFFGMAAVLTAAQGGYNRLGTWGGCVVLMVFDMVAIARDDIVSMGGFLLALPTVAAMLQFVPIAAPKLGEITR